MSGSSYRGIPGVPAKAPGDSAVCAYTRFETPRLEHVHEGCNLDKRNNLVFHFHEKLSMGEVVVDLPPTTTSAENEGLEPPTFSFRGWRSATELILQCA